MDSASPFAGLLVGQPTLNRQLRMGTFAALDQRISVRFAVTGMDLAESVAYLRHPLALAGRTDGPLLLNRCGNRMQRHNAAAIVTALARRTGVERRVTPRALRRSAITIGLLQGRAGCVRWQRAARHTRADTTIAYDQSDRSLHRDPTFVLMTATAR